MELHPFIEHTLLRPDLHPEELERLVAEAITHRFLGVCVPPYWVRKVRRDIGNAAVNLVTVIGFPFGYQKTAVKLAELQQAIADGAQEVDTVLNLAAFRTNPGEWVKPELARLAQEAHQHEVLLKVILETAALQDEEIRFACQLCADAGVDFVKTSTGYGPGGATVHHVRLMRESLPAHVGIKASGGIKTFEQAKSLVEAGATRLGTSSGVAIVTGQHSQTSY